GTANHGGERYTLRDEKLHQGAGTMGDPMRLVASLPGVLQPVPLVPFYVVRGGAPGMNGFFLDGMRVPQLFHTVLLEGTVHPRLYDHLDFYPGGYDASFGRFASGVVDAATRSARTDAPFHGEVEAKLFSADALLEARLPRDVQLVVAGRYGYPSPIIHLVEPG